VVKIQTREKKIVLNNVTQQLKEEIHKIKIESINKYLGELTIRAQIIHS